jgi:hypothetical protein
MGPCYLESCSLGHSFPLSLIVPLSPLAVAFLETGVPGYQAAQASSFAVSSSALRRESFASLGSRLRPPPR